MKKTFLFLGFIFFVLKINFELVEARSSSEFLVPTHTISQLNQPLVSQDKSLKQLVTYNMSGVEKELDFQFYSLENIRGAFQKAAYPNQDYGFVGFQTKKTCIGIFDGHGKKTGGMIAQFVQENLPLKILTYKSGVIGINSACSWMQKKIIQEKCNEAKQGGTTALIGVLSGSQLTIGNIGDSRAIGILSGKLIPLSVDHKPTNVHERNRILKAGGAIHKGYVFGKKTGGLALTRSLGDLLAHDGNIITAKPDIVTVSVRPGDILIFASDGLWDVMSNQEVYNFVKKRVDVLLGLKKATARELATQARKRSSKDDITVAIAVVK